MRHTGNTVGAKPTVVLDMDGVLVDFISGIIRLHNLDMTHDDWTCWDFHKSLGMSYDDLMSPTWDNEFWYELNAYEWANDLVAALQRFRLIVCSRPDIKHPSCRLGKEEWLSWHFPVAVTETAFLQDKTILAGPNVLLIDDNEDNVTDFREAGGAAMLFPQPWNRNRGQMANRLEWVVSTVNRVWPVEDIA